MYLIDMQLFQMVSFLIKTFLCFCDGTSGSVLCEEPPPVPNAYREWSGIGITAEVNYTCYTHYVLISGNLVRNCINGVYSGAEPICKHDCGLPRHLEGATVSYTSTLSDLKSVAYVNYACLPGLKFIGGNKPIKCDPLRHKWLNSRYHCYNETVNIAEGCKAFLADGTNVDHVVDGDTTCKPLADTTFDIYLNETYKILKIFITHSIANITKIAVSAIQNSTGLEKICIMKDYGSGAPEQTKTLISSKYYASTVCYGDIVRIAFTLPTTLSICDIMINGNLFIGDCGRPPVGFSQTVNYTDTTEGSTALLSCLPSFYPAEGHGVITCRGTTWTTSQLTCTERSYLVDDVTNSVYDMALDDNYTTCVNIVSVNNKPTEWSVDLGQDYEIYGLSVTFGEMDMSQSIRASQVANSGKFSTCQFKKPQGAGVVVMYRCMYSNIGQIVTLTGGDVLNLCDVKVKGRYYDEPLECYMSFKSKGYKGKQNVTNHGHECVPWASILPYSNMFGSFPDLSVDEIGNNCRNPSNDRVTPWCFISQTEWQYCSVPECDNICLRAPGGMNYNGNMARSTSNSLCKTWSLLQDNDRFYNELPANNYCGNHVLGQSEPWCIVADDSAVAYEDCFIPGCPKSSNMTTMILSPQSIDSQFLSNVFQCFYNTGSDEVYFHTDISSVFNSACSMTNETRIIYICSFWSKEWKVIEYFCDPIPVSSEFIEPTSAYEDTSNVIPDPIPVSSEYIDPSPAYEDPSNVIPDPIPVSSEYIEPSPAYEDPSNVIPDPIPVSSEYIEPSPAYEDPSNVIPDPIPVSSEYIEPSPAYEDTSSMMELVSSMLSELSTIAFSDPTPSYDSNIMFESVSDAIFTHSDVLMSSESISDLNTDYVSVSGSESCRTPIGNVLCSTTTSTIGVSSYVTETLASTQLVSRSCECYCRSKPPPNITDLGTNQLATPIVENLILNKSNLSRTFRKKNSIDDSRTFAIALGSAGVFIIIGSALFLASSDFARVLMGTSDLVRRVKATTNVC